MHTDHSSTAPPCGLNGKLVGRETRFRAEVRDEATDAVKETQTAVIHQDGATREQHQPPVGRMLPHSLEAEEHLLSCCLLDGAGIIAKAISMGITPASFFDLRHSIVFEHVLALFKRQVSVEPSVLAEELKTARQLEAIGGYAFLAEISSRTPTTAGANYFIDKVREQSLLREIIHSATGAIEDCYKFSGGIDEFLDGIRHRFGLVVEKSGELRTKIENALLDPSAEPPPLVVRFSINGVPVATPGNLVVICAQAKAGKSAFLGGYIAAALANSAGADCLGITGRNTEGLALIHIDTEQARVDHWRIVETARKRSRREDVPDWFRSYSTAGWSASQRRAALPIILASAEKRFGGVHAILIDGVADFVTDPNAADEVFPFVDELHAMAGDFACPIIVVLHQNPGTEKGRGHLGSQLERRAETNLVLEKHAESGRTVVFSTKQRRAPILKSDGPCFRWSEGDQMHVAVGTLSTERAAAAFCKARETAADIFGAGPLRYSAAIEALKRAFRCSESTAERKFNAMRNQKIISKVTFSDWGLAS